MLGEFVDDPDGIEGPPGKTKALGLLPAQTVLKAPKTTTLSNFKWGDSNGKGYEIHMGYTHLQAGKSLLEINSRNGVACNDTDGCISEDGRISGTYMHGFFDSQQILSKWLEKTGFGINLSCEDMATLKDRDYFLLKEHFEAHIDLKQVFQ